MSDLVGDAVFAILSEDTAIADIVGTKIEPNKIPQDADLPYIVYRVVSGVPLASLTGGSGAIDHRLQIDCYSETYQQASEVGNLVRLAMENIRDETHGEVAVLSCNVEDISDLPVGPNRGREQLIEVRSVDVQMWIGVSQPA